MVVTILLGIAGAVVGGFLWDVLIGNRSYGDLDIGGIIIAVIGSLILLGLFRALAGRRHRPPFGTVVGASAASVAALRAARPRTLRTRGGVH